MRRVGHLFEQITDRENLRRAFSQAVRGKRAMADARQFGQRLEENLALLRGSLLQGNVRLGEYHQFTVYDPKQRIITAPSFRERVLHHAIVNVCEPTVERFLIADTYACRRGKGRTHASASRR